MSDNSENTSHVLQEVHRQLYTQTTQMSDTVIQTLRSL